MEMEQPKGQHGTTVGHWVPQNSALTTFDSTCFTGLHVGGQGLGGFPRPFHHTLCAPVFPAGSLACKGENVRMKMIENV